MGNGRWRVRCFGWVMEPKKSFRTSSALSHACHTAGSAVSDPMCVWLSAAWYAGISRSPASVKDNTHHNQNARTHARTYVASWESKKLSCSGPVKRSNLSPSDKHPLASVTFHQRKAGKVHGCTRMRSYSSAVRSCLTGCFIYACRNNRPFI